MKKKIIPFFMVFALILGLFSISPAIKEAKADALNIKSIIESATADITIEITEDTTISDSITIPSGVNVTLKGNNKAKLTILKTIKGSASDLTLEDLNVQLDAVGLYGTKDDHKLIIRGCEITTSKSNLITYTSSANRLKDTGVLYIYSGKINVSGKMAYGKTTQSIVYCPTGDIEVTTSSAEQFNSIKVIPQEGYEITECSLNGESVTDDVLSGMNGGTEAEPYQWFGQTSSDLAVKAVSFKVNSNTPADPTTGGSIQAEGYDVTWGYGGQVTAAENVGQYVITPKEGYAIEQIYVDGVLYAPEAAYAGQTTAYTYTGDVPKRGMSVYFAYTVNFPNPGSGTLSVVRDGKELTSGEIVHGGDILTITYTDESGAYKLDEAALQANGLTGITYVEGTGYVVSAKNGDDTPKIDVSASGVLVPLQKTQSPVIEPASGEVDNGDTVTLTADEGAKIYYTTDGTDPSGNTGRYVYSSPIEIKQEMTIRAIAQKDGFLDSDESSASYTLKTYSISAQSEEGSTIAFTVDGESASVASCNKTVKVNVTPKEGRTLTSLVLVTSSGEKDITSSLSFAMPKEAAILKAEYMDTPEKPSITSVKTESDLRQLALEVNAAGLDYSGITVKLENDIQLENDWLSIGTDYKHPFKGTFDGQGHTVSGLKAASDEEGVRLGFFGHMSEATVKDLTVSGNITSTGTDECMTGGIAGYASGTVIENCVNYVNITTQSGMAGGIVGYCSVGSTVSDCINYGTVTGNSQASEDKKNVSDSIYVGGIAGYFVGNNSNYVTMSGCINEGEIIVTCPTVVKTDNKTGNSWNVYEGHPSCGGLSSWTGCANISKCANHGNVTGPACFQGGLAAYGNNGPLVIKDCYNTGDITNTITYSWQRSRMGGLVGSSYGKYLIQITDSYNFGNVSAPNYISDLGNTPLYESLRYDEIQANDFDCGTTNKNGIKAVCTNTYGTSDIEALEDGRLYAATLNGATGTAWKDSAVYGRPILEFEEEAELQECEVTFEITGAEDYSLSVSKSKDFSSLETGENGIYKLMSGTYYYKVESEGCATELKSFFVTTQPKTFQVELKAGVDVTFNVSPSDVDATLLVTDTNGKKVTDLSSEGGVYKYSLYKDAVYNYTVKADGYVSIGRQIQPSKNETVDITLVKSVDEESVTAKVGNYYRGIYAGGTYVINEGTTGCVISIRTTEPVTIVGNGTAEAYKDVYIKGAVAGVNLTLQDVYISNSDSSNSNMTNLLNFTGEGNKLTFAGENVLEQDTGATGYALIHVNKDTELTISGETAYLYKSEQGAGIGGNGGNGTPLTPETNGKITFDGAKVFVKGTKQGACIGSGAGVGTSETPGEITIKDSELNLITNARGAAIGGSAGETAAQGGTVNVDAESTITVNVDYTGSAIGGGGFNSGNDAAGGTIVYNGGSLRAFIDTNATGVWGTENAGVNGNKAITANVVDGSGNQLYLFTLDTTEFEGEDITVNSDGKLIYSGSTHQWKYVNETHEKESQSGLTATISNWTELDDANVYLYLTGENHTVDINGRTITLAWNEETKSFTVSCNESDHAWSYDMKDSVQHTKTCVYCKTSEDEAHTWDEGICKLCGYKCEHVKDTLQPETPATCTEVGNTGDTVCDNCGYVTKKGNEIPALGHDLVITPEKAATCTEAGATSQIRCSRCEYVELESEEIAALGHKVVVDKAVEATCEHTGLTSGTHCARCEAVLVAQQVLDKKAHTIVEDAAVEATCEHSGLTAGKHCSTCNKVLVAQTVVERLDHSLELVGYKDATCTETGYTGAAVCTKCDKIIMKGVEIPAKGHTIVTDEAVAATATSTGLTEGSHCGVCGKVFKAQEVTPKLIPDGWNKIDGSWYFYKDNVAQKGMIEDNGRKYYTDPTTGIMVTGFKKINGSWYYFAGGNSGRMLTGFQKINGSWFYFDTTTGIMQTGLTKVGSGTYLFKGGDSGKMLTGWQKLGGVWRYFKTGDSGRMLTGWQKINNKYYYLDPSTGIMQTGWVTIGNAKYYCNADGVMVEGWKTISGKTYYFRTNGSGRMLTGKQTINGTAYTFNADGSLVK